MSKNFAHAGWVIPDLHYYFGRLKVIGRASWYLPVWYSACSSCIWQCLYCFIILCDVPSICYPHMYDLSLQLYKELTCPLDNFELLICSMPGPEGKSFPLCPYCYSNPPFEGIDALINSAKTTTSSKTGKGAGMPCNLCPHPTCPNSLVSQGVCACPECSGTLVLDPVSAPKWRLCCNMCNCLVFLAQGAHRISTTKERCPECDSSILEVDFNKKTTPLADGSTLHRGCILCDVLLHSLVEMKHGRGFKSSRGRGRGGRTQRYRGRGRGNAKMMDPKMSFRDF